MKDNNVDPAISDAARALQKLGSKKAGISRWKGRTQEEKNVHAEMMRVSRWKGKTVEEKKAFGKKLNESRWRDRE